MKIEWFRVWRFEETLIDLNVTLVIMEYIARSLL